MPVGRIHKDKKFDLNKFLKKFKQKNEGKWGAIGTFIGTVRKKAKNEKKVKKLHYENAKTAEKELEKIARDTVEEFKDVSEIHIHHRIGDLKPGEDIIYVLVGASHREEVFEALPKIMNRVKTEPKIWKKEITETESYWIHQKENE